MLGCMVATPGCKGTPLSLPQSMTGPTRVPPPATNSYQVPGGYNGASGAPAATSNGLNSSSFGNGANRTSQVTPPVSELVSRISQAESQFVNATNSARDSVNRSADALNSSVQQASARVDRFGQGVVLASSILTEAARAPSFTNSNGPSLPSDLSNQVEMPATNSGRIGDSTSSGDASWRTPIRN